MVQRSGRSVTTKSIKLLSYRTCRLYNETEIHDDLLSRRSVREVIVSG